MMFHAVVDVPCSSVSIQWHFSQTWYLQMSFANMPARLQTHRPPSNSVNNSRKICHSQLRMGITQCNFYISEVCYTAKIFQTTIHQALHLHRHERRRECHLAKPDSSYQLKY